jgi:hypothetical protein
MPVWCKIGVRMLQRTKRTNNYPQNMHIKLKLTLYEDTKGVIRIRILKNRQHNGQKKKYKRKTNKQPNKLTNKPPTEFNLYIDVQSMLNQ